MKKKSGVAHTNKKKKSESGPKKNKGEPPKEKESAGKLRKNKSTYPDRFLANDPIHW